MRLTEAATAARVRFRVESHTPYPYMRCYCSICRKTQGGGGYAINIMGDAADARGQRRASTSRLSRAHPEHGDDAQAPVAGAAAFLRACASALWVSDPRWAQWVYPFASAIDTPLPKPPEEVELMLNYAPKWARRSQGPQAHPLPRVSARGHRGLARRSAG